MAEPAVTFAGLLKQLRTDAGLTQEDLAEAATLSARSISDLERGVNVTARKDTARLLADALHLTGLARAGFEASARGRSSPAAVLAGNMPDDRREAAPQAAVRALPRDVASFTGRERELRELMNAAADSQERGAVVVYVIGGMAGSGKTAFAVHGAHQLASRFPAGQIFLPLHGHTPGHHPVDPADALASLLLTTGIAAAQIPPGQEARMSLWRDRLAGRRLLLVLDDAVGSEQVEPLLPGTSGSLVLVTSRRHLSALEDAQAISLDPLPRDEAAGLLVRLAARPGLTSADAAVEEIARLCGYLPLALGMLARQLHHHPAWTAAGLAAEVVSARDRLELMATENLSVAAAFDLSYRDLTAAQQGLFRRLGLYPGTDIDAYSAAALNDTDFSTARRHLAVLYDHYLLTEPARGRYRMHDLIREYARSLAAAEDAAAHAKGIERLLDYYLSAAAGANRLIARYTPADIPPVSYPPPSAPLFSGRDEAAAWLEAERVNLHACSEYAAAHAFPKHAVWIPAQLGAFLRITGYWDQALPLHERAARTARATGDLAGEAVAIDDLASVQFLRGDYSSSAESSARRLDLCRELGDRAGQAKVLTHLGMLQVVIGDYPAAAASLSRSRDLYDQLGDKQGLATALNTVGILRRYTGDYQHAAESLQQALTLYADLGNQNGEANVRNELGMVQCLTGDYQAATASLSQALTLCRELGAKHGQASALNGFGILQRLTGDYLAADASLTHALALYDELGDRQGKACVLNELGALLADSGSPDAALARYSEALGTARDSTSKYEEARALEGSGVCHLRLGDSPAAGAFLGQALQIYQQIGSPGAGRVQQLLDSGPDATSGPGARPR